MNNYEKIKSMSVDELAIALISAFACGVCSSPEAHTTALCPPGSCEEYCRKWLMEECKDE